MIKKPSKELSTFTLYKYDIVCDATTGEILNNDFINDKLIKLLSDSKKCQQEMLNNCIKNDIQFNDTGFHTTNARILINTAQCLLIIREIIK